MCKAHSKVTHIKQQKYFHHLKGRGYNNSVLYPGRLRWWKYFCCFICVTLLWALHIVIKQQFFLHLYNPQWPQASKSVKRACDGHGRRTSDRRLLVLRTRWQTGHPVINSPVPSSLTVAVACTFHWLIGLWSLWLTPGLFEVFVGLRWL